MTESKSLFTDSQIAEWADAAVDHDAREWANEEARWSKSLYVGNHTEADRRSIHGEAKRGIKAAHRFWASIPVEARERVTVEAALWIEAIPEDLRP